MAYEAPSLNQAKTGWINATAVNIEDATGKATSWIERVGDTAAGFFRKIAGGLSDVKESVTGATVQVKPDNTIYIAVAAILGVWLITSKRR